MKLGEILVGRTMITKSDLEEALNAQLVYGGHLGTCLIELGCVGERELGAVLAEEFGIAYAPPEAFLEILPFVIGALPAKLAEKHHSVPLALENKVLEVAMVDPKNLAAVDELRFASGYTIEARVSAEVRIYQALERYYDIPRRLRYVRLCDMLEHAPEITPSDSVQRAEATPADTHAVEMGVENVAVPRPTEVAAPAGGTATATATVERRVRTKPAPAGDAFDTLTELMCRVKDETMLSKVVLDHVAPSLPRTILFRVNGGMATIWASRGLASPECSEIAITSEPVFRLLAGQSEYLGPVPDGELYSGFFERLGFRPPRQMVLSPAYLNDNLVALLYGHACASGAGSKPLPSFRRLTDKLALAIGLVELKRRLREN